jgi:hypothetical protein
MTVTAPARPPGAVCMKAGFTALLGVRSRDAYVSVGRNVRTTSYMPGSNFAIVSASSRKGRGPGSRRMDS